eukprot:605072-Amphidinium_carterae.1
MAQTPEAKSLMSMTEKPCSLCFHPGLNWSFSPGVNATPSNKIYTSPALNAGRVHASLHSMSSLISSWQL